MLLMCATPASAQLQVVQYAQSTSGTVTFNPVAKGDAVVIIMETYGNGFLGFSQSCVDNLNHVWVMQYGYANGAGETVYAPAAGISSEGLSSVTCTNFTPFGWAKSIMDFYEVSGTGIDQRLHPTCRFIYFNASAETEVTILRHFFIDRCLLVR